MVGEGGEDESVEGGKNEKNKKKTGKINIWSALSVESQFFRFSFYYTTHSPKR